MTPRARQLRAFAVPEGNFPAREDQRADMTDQLNSGEFFLKPVAVEVSNARINDHATQTTFIFHYAKDGKEWSQTWSANAAFEFGQLTRYEPTPIADHDWASICELRKYGFLNLTLEGSIADPVSVSVLGVQVSEVMAAIQFEPLGTRRELT